MSFRKYGGLNYSSTNNIVRNHYSNSDNKSISDVLGEINTKIVSKSHIDMSANSLMNTGAVYYMDGNVLTSDYLA